MIVEGVSKMGFFISFIRSDFVWFPQSAISLSVLFSCLVYLGS